MHHISNALNRGGHIEGLILLVLVSIIVGILVARGRGH